MTNYISARRAALAFAILATTLVLSGPVRAAEEQKPPETPRAEKPKHDDSESQTNDRNRSHCKKIYRVVHRGPPGKGSDVSVFDHLECPTSHA